MTKTTALNDFLLEMAAQPGVTDITLCQDGRVSLRCNGRLAVRTVESLGGMWDAALAQWRWGGLGPDSTSHPTGVILEGAEGQRLWMVPFSGGGLQSLAVRVMPARPESAAELQLPEAAERTVQNMEGGLFLVAGTVSSRLQVCLASLVSSRIRLRGGKVIGFGMKAGPRLREEEGSLLLAGDETFPEVDRSEAIRLAAECDPDLICVEGLRTAEELSAVLATSLSGISVLATVTADSISSCFQVLSLMLHAKGESLPAREALASCLEGVLSRQMQSGFETPVPVHELLLFRDAERRLSSVERLIREKAWPALSQEMETGRRLGMVTREESLGRLVEAGLLPAYQTRGGRP